MKEYNNDDDFNNKSDEEIKNETLKILEEDVFNDVEKVEVVKEYNNYRSNNVIKDYEDTYGESNTSHIEDRKKKDLRLLKKIFGVIIIIAILFIFSVVIVVKNAYNNLEEIMVDKYYDVEYDLDNDGYLDYEEMDRYELEKASDYERFYTAKELFVDKEDRTIYFEIENRNSYKVDFADLKIAFYDENKKLIDVVEEPISNILVNGKIIERVHYRKEFASYEVVVTVEDYSTDIEEREEANVSLISTREKVDSNDIEYVIKNNSSKSVSGDVYVIFYDENKNIVNIEEDYIFDLGSGKTATERVYVFSDVDYSSLEVDLSGITVDEY